MTRGQINVNYDPQNSKEDMLSAALKLASLGYAVFPVHSVTPDGKCTCGKNDCSHIGKHPRTKNGLKNASKDPGQIRQWWTVWPEANIGLPTGLTNQGLVVLDVDNHKNENGMESWVEWNALRGYTLPPDTWQAITGSGGQHILFHTNKNIQSRIGILSGIDVRADGGYIVAPPSNHVSGRRYEWEIGSEDMTAPIELPPEVEELMLYDENAIKHGTSAPFIVPETVAEGARNATMFKIACSLKAKGLSTEGILAAVIAENEARCCPALDEKEIEIICRSAEKYKPGEEINRISASANAEEAIAHAVTEGDADSLVSDEVLKSIFCIPDELERERKLMSLRKRAQKLKCARSFENMVKMYAEKMQRNTQSARFENMTDFTDAPFTLSCGHYTANDGGVDGNDGTVCTHPILPVASLIDVDTGMEKAEIAFKRGKIWRTITVDRSIIASPTAIISLADRGVAVNSENAKFLIQYLADLEAWNQSRIPQYRSVSNLGWVGNGFSPNMPELKFSGDEMYRGFYTAVRAEGTYDRWRETALNIRENSPIGRAALATSFASPLVSMLQKLNFITHIWGVTGSAKTVALMLAMSVWGNPTLGGDGLLNTFNATFVGIERLAGFFRSMPLALDELQCKAAFTKDFDAIVYMLCEGRGRSRGKKSGGLELVPWWKNCTISTGEQPLTEERSGGGAKNRILDIHCSGLIFKDAPAIAGCVQENFGWAGSKYIEALQRPEFKGEAERLYNSFYKQITDSGKTTDKQAMAVSMLALGDYFSGIFIFKCEQEDALFQTKRFVDRLLTMTAGTGDVDDIGHIYDWIIGWLAENQEKFSALNTYCAAWGVRQDDGGYWIISKVLCDALTAAGFSHRKTLAGLAERGEIETFTCGGKTEFTRHFRTCGTNPRCVHLLADTEIFQKNPD